MEQEIERIRGLLSSLERAHSLIAAGEGSGDFKEVLTQLRIRVEAMDGRISHITGSLEGVNLGLIDARIKNIEDRLKLSEERRWQAWLAFIAAAIGWVATLVGMFVRFGPDKSPESASPPAAVAPAQGPGYAPPPTKADPKP